MLGDKIKHGKSKKTHRKSKRTEEGIPAGRNSARTGERRSAVDEEGQ